jgi:hypothetical protein
MNRRNFVKSTVVASIAFPTVSLGLSIKEKRFPNSLFTIDQLKTFCDMNNLHYVEDNEVWLDEYKTKRFTHEGKNFMIYKRWPFLHKNNPEQWYECLRWNALSWKSEYKHFFLYDIQETTLPFQKDQGEFYSMVVCSKLRYDTDNNKLRERLKHVKVYCIKNKCWYKPTYSTDPTWWYVDNLVKV